MKQRIFALLFVALFLTPLIGATAGAADRPNILLIAVDDMGIRILGPSAAK